MLLTHNKKIKIKRKSKRGLKIQAFLNWIDMEDNQSALPRIYMQILQTLNPQINTKHANSYRSRKQPFQHTFTSWKINQTSKTSSIVSNQKSQLKPNVPLLYRNWLFGQPPLKKQKFCEPKQSKLRLRKKNDRTRKEEWFIRYVLKELTLNKNVVVVDKERLAEILFGKNFLDAV